MNTEEKIDLVLTAVQTLGGRFDNLEVRFDNLEKRMDNLEKRFDNLENRFEKRFDDIDRHFAVIDSRLKDMDRHFAVIDSRLEDMGRHFADIDNRLDRVESNTSSLRAGQIEIRKDIHRLHDKVEETYNIALEAWGQSTENRRLITS